MTAFCVHEMLNGATPFTQPTTSPSRLMLGKRRKGTAGLVASTLFIDAMGPSTPSKPSEDLVKCWADCQKLGYTTSITIPVVESVSRAIVASMAEDPEGPTAIVSSNPLVKPQKPNIFDSSQVPPISVERYLKRLQGFFRCSDSALVGALIILDRFLAKCESTGQEPRSLTSFNVHRLYLACLVATVKYNEDLIYGNSHYAKAGGIHVREVNRMERHLLFTLDWNLRVQPEEYLAYEEALHSMSMTFEATQGASGDAAQAAATAAAAALLRCGGESKAELSNDCRLVFTKSC